MWDAGILLVEEPFLLFAAWEDGTVIRRTKWDARYWADRKAGTLKVGKVSPAEVRRLVDDFVKTVWFEDAPQGYALRWGLIPVDGEMLRMAVRHGDKEKVLSYGPRLDLKQYGPTSSPSRAEVIAFVQMWNQAAAAIKKVEPPSWQDYSGGRVIEYPQDNLETKK
jgi:hypothetical protein